MKYGRKTFLDRKEQEEIIGKILQNRLKIHGKIPITGRSAENYAMQLFPDMTPIVMKRYIGRSHYLDMACGINHMYPESLLCSVKGSKKKDGLDIHSLPDSSDSSVRYYKGDAYKMAFEDNAYDCITVNNFMYFWERHPSKLLKLYKELYRVCKSGGEVRIFPVFFGNYACDNVELYDFLNKRFKIQCLRPTKNYSKESPVYVEDDTIKVGEEGHGTHERRNHNELMSHVIILTKI